ncbi:MAG: TlyA family RNA methyltransferase [Nitrospirae bacterium]|nr:TlyA family RNA methyltransferase [Nitrospirota bacterium]
MSKSKIRLDTLLVDRGLVSTRQQAISTILSGNVYLEGQQADKAGRLVSEDAEISIKAQMPYVSRGGLKLEEALRTFKISVSEKVAIDIGASTGGFTDCLLQHGAIKVYAIDVGYGQLHYKLRNDPRVRNLEKTHILKLDWALITDHIDIATIDLSFISVTYVLPVVREHLPADCLIVVLVKPQFEVGKGEVGKGGIVRDMDKVQLAVKKVQDFAEGIGFEVRGLIPSPILGQKGNVEYLLYLGRQITP